MRGFRRPHQTRRQSGRQPVRATAGNRTASSRRQPTRTSPSGPPSLIGRTTAIVALGAIALVAFLVYAVVQAANPAPPGPSEAQRAALDADPDLPGTYVKPHPGPDGAYGTGDDAQHMGQGVSLPICGADLIEADARLGDVDADRSAIAGCYNSNPPTSGPMSGQTGAFRIYENPVPKEAFVHSMEHAGVVVWYNSEDEEIRKKLESIVEGQLDRLRPVAMVPYPEMEPETIALTSWTRLDKFPVSDFSRERIETFIATHNRRYNPEGF